MFLDLDLNTLISVISMELERQREVEILFDDGEVLGRNLLENDPHHSN